jgi:hypothetical protein
LVVIPQRSGGICFGSSADPPQETSTASTRPRPAVHCRAGLETVSALLSALREDPQQLGSEGPEVLAELEEYVQVLRKTHEHGLRWHLAVSWR